MERRKRKNWQKPSYIDNWRLSGVKDEERKDEPKIGFIADDTDSIFSGLNKDKMDVYNCIGMLLKAVQELNDKIKKLENQAAGA